MCVSKTSPGSSIFAMERPHFAAKLAGRVVFPSVVETGLERMTRVTTRVAVDCHGMKIKFLTISEFEIVG